MVGRTLLDAGTIVLALLLLFSGLVTLTVLLSIDALWGIDATSEHIAELRAKLIEWSGLTFGALLGALGVKAARRKDDDDGE